MGDERNSLKESASVIKEIEDRLEEAISRKKEQIEKELEERINREKEEAKKQIDQIEKEFDEEKQALKTYRDTVDEYENNRAALNKQIKEHLNKAVRFQKEIETLTARTLEELRRVEELSLKLETLQKEAEEKASGLKRNLEEKFGIAAEALKTNEYKDVRLDLEKELAKLRKIKELLAAPGEELRELIKEEREEKEEAGLPEIEAEEEEEKEGSKPSEPSEKKTEEEEKREEPLEEKEDIKEEAEAEIPVEREEEEAKEPEEEKKEEAAEEERKAEEPEKPEEPEASIPEKEEAFEEVFESLKQYQHSESIEDNGEIRYFQNNDRVIMDGEFLIGALNSRLDEARKLYQKITQTESPKDQFFVKQEIIRHQEALRKVILRSVRMCEEESCSLPRYTMEILNMDVLKDILEKLNMDNWSNQDDFVHFEKYVNNLKSSYSTRITPHADYAKSLMEELRAG
ncbi:MAG: hypothetical protein ACLFVG_10215 [Candidatus Aminicenantes bacterium]